MIWSITIAYSASNYIAHARLQCPPQSTTSSSRYNVVISPNILAHLLQNTALHNALVRNSTNVTVNTRLQANNCIEKSASLERREAGVATLLVAPLVTDLHNALYHLKNAHNHAALGIRHQCGNKGGKYKPVVAQIAAISVVQQLRYRICKCRSKAQEADASGAVFANTWGA
jgi:hypothetical protein